VTRVSCLESFAVGRGNENTLKWAVGKGHMCKEEGGKALVQGWNGSLWLNNFAVGFGRAG
jgi:hypothetical protein